MGCRVVWYVLMCYGYAVMYHDVWCGIVLCGIVRCGIMLCGVVWHCVMLWCHVMLYGVVLCGVVV